MPLFFRFIMAIFLFAVGFYVDRIFDTGIIPFAGAILGFIFSGRLFFWILKFRLGGLATGCIMGFSIASVIIYVAEIFQYSSNTFRIILLTVFIVLSGLFGHLFLSSEGVGPKKK